MCSGARDCFERDRFWGAYLHTRFAEIDAQTVRVLAVVLHEILEISECGPPGNEEATLVQLPDTIVLHRVAVAHYNNQISSSPDTFHCFVALSECGPLPPPRNNKFATTFYDRHRATSPSRPIIIHLFDTRDVSFPRYDATGSFYYRPDDVT